MTESETGDTKRKRTKKTSALQVPESLMETRKRQSWTVESEERKTNDIHTKSRGSKGDHEHPSRAEEGNNLAGRGDRNMQGGRKR